MPMLQGKIACITGASAGIGEACARVLAREGAALLLSARRTDRVKALANDLGKQHGIKTHVNQLDVQKRDDVSRYVEGLPPEWQQIDILVNNAGLSRGLDKLHEGSIQDWEEMIDTNIKGLLYVTRAILPGMVKRDSGQFRALQ